MNKSLRGFLFLIPCVVSCCIALAQPPDPEPGPVVLATRVIKVRHVWPSLVAWWIRPGKNREPITIAQARRSYVNLGIEDQFKPDTSWFGKDDGIANSVFSKKKAGDSLPIAGLYDVSGIDVRNEVLAYGTEESLDELEEVVAQLDQPAPKIEVTIFHIEADDEAVKVLGISRENDWQIPAHIKEPQQFESEVKKLRDAGNVRSLVSPRVRISNGYAQSMESAQIMYEIKLSVDIGEANFFTSKLPYELLGENPVISFMQRYGFFVAPKLDKNGQINLSLKVANPVYLNSQLIRNSGTQDKNEVNMERLRNPDNLLLLEPRILLSKTLQVTQNEVAFVGEWVDSKTDVWLPLKQRQTKMPEKRILVFVSAQVVKDEFIVQ